VWKTQTCSKAVPTAEKQGRGIWDGSQASQNLTVETPPTYIITVDTIKTNAAAIQFYFGNTSTEIMLDSGSALSPVRQDKNLRCHSHRYSWLQQEYEVFMVLIMLPNLLWLILEISCQFVTVLKLQLRCKGEVHMISCRLLYESYKVEKRTGSFSFVLLLLLG